MQNIVAHHVKKERPVPHGNGRRGTWVGCLLCLQGHWWCSSTSLSLCNTAVWGGAEVMRCENSIKRSRGNHLYQRNTGLGDERKNGAWWGHSHEKVVLSWFLQGLFLGLQSGPGRCHSSVAALGQGQGGLGPCPTSLVLGSPGEIALVWGFILFVVFFIPSDPNRNIRLSGGCGDTGRCLPTRVQLTLAGALVPPALFLL